MDRFMAVFDGETWAVVDTRHDTVNGHGLVWAFCDNRERAHAITVALNRSS